MKTIRFILLSCLMLLAVPRVHAYGNDYLEKQDHYTVMNQGNGAIHFKIPVFSRGGANYMLRTTSDKQTEFYYRYASVAHTLFTIDVANDECNRDDDYSYGRVTVSARGPEIGILEVTNVYSGAATVVQSNSTLTLNVTKAKEIGNDNDYVVWLEINWYMPESLDDQTFSLHSIIKVARTTTGGIRYEEYFDFGEFNGGNPMIDAQLYDPFFYTSKDVPASGFGYAAVPYVLSYDPKSYYTYFGSPTATDLQHSLNISKRADNIYVPTTDTVQPGFRATFNVYRTKTPAAFVAQTTNAVPIPAYHRIYDFQAHEQRDDYDTYTGKNLIIWQLKCPDAVDLVEGDFFEVQRALKSDFSDARTFEVVPMEKGADKHLYVVEDDSREMLSGNAELGTDTVDTHVQTTLENYALRTANGDTLCVLDITATSDKLKLPAVPVYYRVRRASASMWGWKGHDFAAETLCMKHSFLAPLANTQPDYTLDANYADNKQVHFRIQIENAEENIGIPAAEDVQLNYKVKEIDSVTVTLKPGDFSDYGLNVDVKVFPLAASGDMYESYTVAYPTSQDKVLRLPYGTVLELYGATAFLGYSLFESMTLTDPASEIYLKYWGVAYTATLVPKNSTPEIDALLASVRPQLLDSVRPLMVARATEGLGRCTWDKTARLILMKTMDGVTQQIIIPQDSIRRLENGNWEAHYVDVADHACTNYSYAVRIDQSDADLHVSDSVYLRTKGIHGPNLYFDEAASIKSFDATYGDIGGYHKSGIALVWEPTTAAVDYYVLTRTPNGQGKPWDTIYVGTDVSYFDTDVNVEDIYLYKVTAVYECNGRHTERSATDLGTRLPYGEISGSILMPDNSGMAGVTVSLYKDNGDLLSKCITDADGYYHFDTIRYFNSTGRDFTIVPSAQYGEFHFNNTTAATAIVHLSWDNTVVRNINFENVSTVRLSGRALYKGSTIPVAGAHFLLNGKSVIRNNTPLATGIDGNFELTLTKGQPYTLQIVKDGHTFEGEGILHVEQDKDSFALSQSLDGVRFYDETKVRLVGRVAGGNIQRDLPEAFGLGKNNLGDDLQLVLQLEGDNVSQLVHDPNDLTRDTVQRTFPHMVYSTDPLNAAPERTVGSTSMLMEKKRIIIRPDTATGEFAVDLYPVKYKVIQASARGYASLFAAGQGSETFDLTEAPLAHIYGRHGTDSIHYNAVYDRIYHTPVQIHMQQMLNGLPQDGYGEKTMKVSSFYPENDERAELYQTMNDGTILYMMGYPLFYANRKYQFEAQAYEDYYYNNDPELGGLDRVPQRGGSVTIHNGMDGSTVHYTYTLDSLGRNRNIYLTVDQLETEFTGTDALHTVSAALEMEGNTVETEVFRAFVTGDRVLEKELQSTDAAISILDIVRDPGGNGSSAWVESGATYNYSYSDSYDIEFGVEFTPTYGVSVNTEIGTITGMPSGTYAGTHMSTNKEFAFSIPVTHEIAWNDKYSYTFTTSNKISTSSSKNKQGIGSNADVFLGVTTSMLTGKAKSVAIINDTLYQQRQPAIQAGTLKVLAHGVDGLGKPYYLVVGEKVMMGTLVSNTFVYTQAHIINTILPRLFLERDNLLESYPDQASAQAEANRRGTPVYWYIDSLTAAQAQQPLEQDTWKMITPQGNNGVYVNRVEALENMITHWIVILANNEEEKIKARYISGPIGVYSVSAGSSYTHSDSYSSIYNYSHKPSAMSFGSNSASTAVQFAQTWIKNVGNAIFSGRLKDASQKLISSATKMLDKISQMDGKNFITELGSQTGGSSFKTKITPVIELDMDFRSGSDVTNKKSTGFSIVPDNQGEITVAVYRAPLDSIWSNKASTTISKQENGVPSEQQYGSYVFFTQAGSSFCIYEDEDKTQFYNPGTLLNNSTMLIAKPAMSINTFEQTNVLPDQRAKFTVELRNAGEIQYGWAGSGMLFTLSLANETNPHGAKLYVNGAPLSQGIEFFMEPGQTITQTIEVERGEVDDYDNMRLMFKVSDCPKNIAFLDFSVHYIPLSCDVQIDMPRQNWVMNTLSQRDSTGYYIPVEISGFDIHHKNFDHIEFQYKLSKESEDMWVNQCSFYADESLYEKATGNKALIENGRIVPFRFYGERDPMEQEYDLRAVSFCRYGSGYVHKASSVISGVKDTRRPVLFGDPEPVNSILAVGDHLKLRFSEPIAGNYLDEDNNFSLKGVTNKTGITAGTSLHFDGSENSYATTKVNRDLSDKSVTIELLVKPSESNQAAVFFAQGSGKNTTTFGITTDLRLYLASPLGTVYSKPLEAMLDFTHVTMVYNRDQNKIRFFAGTQELTDSDQPVLKTDGSLFYQSPLVFGKGFNGNMLEARVWSKALTPEEIAASHMKRLTGYERGLTAYYPMNEGRSESCTDKANGATLYLHNTTWTLQKGISLRFENDSVKLDGNLMSRSEVYDVTLMFWFKTTSANTPIFRAGWVPAHYVDEKIGDYRIVPDEGTWIGLEDGLITLYNDTTPHTILFPAADNEWHHFALAVNRAYNTAAFYIDGQLKETIPATAIEGIKGAMYLGGKDFVGNIDELTIYEQALPRSLIEERYNMAPAGDEMGLIAYLPFSRQILNPNGVLELVFSPNDQRIFKKNGEVVDKVVPLVLTEDAAAMADKTDFAPVRDHGLLNKLKFGWAFNTDELLINLTMQDYEINKQTVYVTVRDVEDLHGNPIASPVTWSAFVDRNTLKWEKRDVYYSVDFDNQELSIINYQLSIRNVSGRTHQYTIDNVPEWLSVRTASGTLTALEEKPIELRLTREMAPGEYTETIYLTDENGLAEPLNIHLTVTANAPYGDIDESIYELNMSVCARVFVNTSTMFGAADEEDIVYAFCNHQLVGSAHVSFNDRSNETELFLTVNGNDAMTGKPVTFRLWRASTGKTYSLYCPREINFAHGTVEGCGDATPLYLTTTGTEMMSIPLNAGWNWISVNLDLSRTQGVISKCVSGAEPWTKFDVIKTPASQQMATYSEIRGRFEGDLKNMHYSQMYMVYSKDGNTMRISGDQLAPDSMHLTLLGDGRWNALPCLLSQTTSLSEAMADYYDHATAGDIIKAKKHFAYYSADKRWVGDLTALTPGEGYLFRRMGQGAVDIHFYDRPASAAMRKSPNEKMSKYGNEEMNKYVNPDASANMTMIAKLNSEAINAQGNKREAIKVYVGDELAGVAEPIDSLYFLTILSDKAGQPLRFETEDGQVLSVALPESYSFSGLTAERSYSVSGLTGEAGQTPCVYYVPNAHHGSLKAPVMLRMDDHRPYKILENNHVIIIKNGEKYDIVGKKIK